MDSVERQLLCCVAKFVGADGKVVEKVYFQHIGNHTKHDAQMAIQAIIDNVTEIEDLRGRKFEGILIKSDNCSHEFKDLFWFMVITCS